MYSGLLSWPTNPVCATLQPTGPRRSMLHLLRFVFLDWDARAGARTWRMEILDSYSAVLLEPGDRPAPAHRSDRPANWARLRADERGERAPNRRVFEWRAHQCHDRWTCGSSSLWSRSPLPGLCAEHRWQQGSDLGGSERRYWAARGGRACRRRLGRRNVLSINPDRLTPPHPGWEIGEELSWWKQDCSFKKGCTASILHARARRLAATRGQSTLLLQTSSVRGSADRSRSVALARHVSMRKHASSWNHASVTTPVVCACMPMLGRRNRHGWLMHRPVASAAMLLLERASKRRALRLGIDWWHTTGTYYPTRRRRTGSAGRTWDRVTRKRRRARGEHCIWRSYAREIS